MEHFVKVVNGEWKIKDYVKWIKKEIPCWMVFKCKDYYKYAQDVGKMIKNHEKWDVIEKEINKLRWEDYRTFV